MFWREYEGIWFCLLDFCRSILKYPSWRCHVTWFYWGCDRFPNTRTEYKNFESSGGRVEESLSSGTNFGLTKSPSGFRKLKANNKCRFPALSSSYANQPLPLWTNADWHWNWLATLMDSATDTNGLLRTDKSTCVEGDHFEENN